MTSRGQKGKKSDITTKTTCDFESCPDYTQERLDSLNECRSLLEESDFSVFTSGIRLKIVLMLLKMESACGCEIQYALNESRQPLVSHHLSMMQKVGWLKSERLQKWTFYSLVDEKRITMQSLFQGISQNQ